MNNDSPCQFLSVRRPTAPLQCWRNYRFIVIFDQLQFGVFIVKNFKLYHPAKLFYALCITRYALILAHNILEKFDKS